MFKNSYVRWGLVVASFLLVIHVVGRIAAPEQSSSNLGQKYVTYSDFYKQIDSGDIVSITNQTGSSQVFGRLKDGSEIHTNVPAGSEILKDARAKNIAVDIQPPASSGMSGIFLSLGMMLVPVLVLVGFLWWMQRRQSNEIRSITRPDKAFKSKEVINPEDNPHRLKDVAGCDEAKEEVAEVVAFLKNPEFYQRVGARSPRGILMSGPPGTGKTLLAKAIAGEAKVPFFSASGSDFMEMFVGVGASRVRALFEKAKSMSPSIIFIDEIDSVGRARSNNNYGSNDERDQTLNALLVEMDGFTPNTNVVVIAATNRSDILDPALTRAGRFDREVSMSLPDKKGREDILKVHGAGVPIANDVNWEEIARGTPGFSGSDLSNLVNEAAVLAARSQNTLVTRKDFDEARDKILMGVQRSPLKNQEERTIVAYHEAGHAIVAHFTEGSEPVHKISIVPRGRALGVTVQLPKEDSYNHSEKKLLGDITILMGGRAAEDVALSQRTVGASNDFMRATVLARRMIASWGMDPDFGPISVDGERGNDWAGSDVWSETIKKDIDERVKTLLKTHYDRACELLRSNRTALDTVAKALLERETLDAEEFEQLVGGLLDPSIPVPQTPAFS